MLEFSSLGGGRQVSHPVELHTKSFGLKKVRWYKGKAYVLAIADFGS